MDLVLGPIPASRMELLIIKWTIDIALALLAWLVQVIIYPGFAWIKPEQFVRWHQNYSRNISFFVFPLMTSQLIVSLAYVWFKPTFLSIAAIILVGFAWINTFGFAIPIHSRLSRGWNREFISQLVRVNRWRTVSWSLVVIIDLWLIIKS